MSKSSMITVSHGFQYSINIKYDVKNHNKITSYIPTEKSINLLEHFLESLEDQSTDRSLFLIGPYGTGKSHLLATFAALIGKKIPEQSFAPIIEKIGNNGRIKTAKNIKDLINNKKPYLTVLINGNNNNLKNSFIQGLVEAIKDAKLEIKPKTAYAEIEEMIFKWKNDFPNTYDTFRKYLFDQYDITIDQFQTSITECSPDAYNIFIKLYPLLTSGAQFNAFNIDNIAELYEDVSQKINHLGYSGIFVIFDEFNKLLESAVKNRGQLDLKPLQDFAEMCNRSESNQVHITLVSHQYISQYASKLSNELMNEWRKVEGRFSTFELNQQSSKIYSLISNVIIKDPQKWHSFMNSNTTKFSKLKNKTSILGIFKELTEQELDNWVIKGCYPLHPISTFCLPRLSNKVAQNERSIFTFLATNDFYSLGKFLESTNQSKFNLLTLDYLFDYFANSMRKLPNNDNMYQTWVKVNEAINKLPKPMPLAEKILKVLGVITGLREEQIISPTRQIIKYAFYYIVPEKEIDQTLNELAAMKIIYIKRTDEKIQFFSGSDEDFGAEIEKIKNNQRYQSHFYLTSILNEHFTPYPIIANRYNDEFEMTRYFLPIFYTVNDLKKGIDWNEELISKGYLDGIVAIILAENHLELNEAKTIIANTRNHQVIFALPNLPLEIKEEAFDYQALQILKSDQNFLSRSPLVQVELNAYIDDYYSQIEEEINKIINPQLGEATYYHNGDNKKVKTVASLSKLVSSICESKNVFGKTPKINNEMINKTNITSNIAKARKKINKKIITNNREKNLGLTGYGPDMSIFRSVLKRTMLYKYNEETSTSVLSKFDADSELKEILDVISEWLQSTIDDSKSFHEIYDKLRKPPYGIRPGIIPILLSVSLKEFKDTLIIKNKQGMEVPLSADVLELIAKNPEIYRIQIESWELIKEIYIQGLSNMFKSIVPNNELTTNKIYPVATTLMNWFIGLPKFTRETKDLSNEARSLQAALKYPSYDSKELLFKRLPNNFNINMDVLLTEDKVRDLLDQIKKGKQELDAFIYYKREKINQQLLDIFDETNSKNSYNAIVMWYNQLDSTTQNHLFNEITERFFELIRNNSITSSNQFINKVAFIVSSLYLEDWNDQTCDTFIEQIKMIKNEVEMFSTQTISSKNLVKIHYTNENGQQKELSFQNAKVSSLGKTLYNTLEDQVEAFAESIPINEKRQVILHLLEKLNSGGSN